MRGTRFAWSEGGLLLVMSRLFRRGAEILQDGAERLDVAGATRTLRQFQPSTLEQAIEVAERFAYARISITPMQISSEIRGFLGLLASDPPARTLEIGTGRGGTLYLIAQIARPDATLISIDVPHGPPRFGGQPEYPRRERLYRSFGRGHQRLVFIAADSHAHETYAQVKHSLAGAQLDVLFIDGDHTKAGVEADFEMYSPLVRNGGFVAFHDIVPGPAEAVGGVPSFWQKVRTPEAKEFVENWNQEGYGIGVLRL